MKNKPTLEEIIAAKRTMRILTRVNIYNETLWAAYLADAKEYQLSSTQAVSALVARGLEHWAKEKGLL